MNKITISKSVASVAVIVALATLAGCSKSTTTEHKPGQALASVNGQEITVLQLNEEMARANVQPAQQDAARKQLLQVLVDRQLLQSEAEKEKLDRDPKVVQAIERAKSLIIAQAYLQKHVGNVGKPTKQEVEDYFTKNPQFFSNRKQYVMNEILVSGPDMTPEVKAAADAARSLDDLAAWLDAHKIKFQRGQVVRSSSDMPPELTSKISSLPKGQLFVVKEAQRALFLAVSEIKDAPVTLATAAPQIEQFLLNKKNKEAAEAELARLRSTAKIEYLNGQTAPATTGPGAPGAATGGAAATAAAPEATTTAAAETSGATDRGVAGLK